MDFVKIENGKNVHQHHFYDLEPIHEQEAELNLILVNHKA